MISRFVVFGCHGNMDFCKITIMTIVSGKDFTSISTKESLLIVV